MERPREGRMGFLVVKPLQYQVKEGAETITKKILVQLGWCPQGHLYEEEKGESHQCFKGMLREKEQMDYIHKNMAKEDISQFSHSTYIDPAVIV